MDVEVPSVSNVYGPGSWVTVGATGKCFGKVTRSNRSTLGFSLNLSHMVFVDFRDVLNVEEFDP